MRRITEKDTKFLIEALYTAIESEIALEVANTPKYECWDNASMRSARRRCRMWIQRWRLLMKKLSTDKSSPARHVGKKEVNLRKKIATWLVRCSAGLAGKGKDVRRLRWLDEKSLRNEKVKWPQSLPELIIYIEALVNREHDYGTCVYAMSMGAVATFYYISRMLGATGFQASCADMDILKRTRLYENGYKIINYENLLYPQYINREHFPTHEELLEENKKQLAQKARELLVKHGDAHPNVKARWQYVAGLSS